MPNRAKTPMTTRSILIDDAVTTISLEDTLWRQLEDVAEEHDLTVSELISLIEGTVSESSSLSAAVRTFVAMGRVKH